MKAKINQKIKNMKAKIYNITRCFEKLDKKFITLGLYNTKYKKLVKNLLFLDYEVKNLEPNFTKIEEAVCSFLQRW